MLAYGLYLYFRGTGVTYSGYPISVSPLSAISDPTFEARSADAFVIRSRFVTGIKDFRETSSVWP